MAHRTFCDGCGNEAPGLLRRRGDDGMERCPPVGEPGDGLSRQLSLRLGTHLLTMDLCVGCHGLLRSLLAARLPEMARTRESWWVSMGGDPADLSPRSPMDPAPAP